jgi:hypothetical protein
MPSASKKQHNFMAAVANNPKFAKKAGVSSAVGKEFLTADKGKTFRQGGTMKKMNPGMMAMMAKKKSMKMNEGGMAHSDVKMDKKVVKKAVGMHDKQQHGGKKTNLTSLKSGGTFRASANGVATKGKTKGTMIAMKSGGKTC